jgi:hypothetical protein
MSEQTLPLIYTAISSVMNECGAITKAQKNAQQGFMYRGIDAVMNALQPVMVTNGIFVVPEVLEHSREERQTAKGGTLLYSVMTIRYTFYAKDGSSVCATVIGEGMDSGDKASNKAMSVAFKYACFQVFCIPTEEMKDPDAETPPLSTPKPAQTPPIHCQECKHQLLPIKNKGEVITPEAIAENTKKTYGKTLCYECAKKHAEEGAAG